LITYEEARAIVAVKRAGLSRPEDEFALEPPGYDGGERWVIYCYNTVIPVLFATVNKATGEYQEHHHIPHGVTSWEVAPEPPKVDQGELKRDMAFLIDKALEAGGPLADDSLPRPLHVIYGNAVNAVQDGKESQQIRDEAWIAFYVVYPGDAPYPGSCLTLSGGRWLLETGEVVTELTGRKCDLTSRTRKYWEGAAGRGGHNLSDFFG